MRLGASIIFQLNSNAPLAVQLPQRDLKFLILTPAGSTPTSGA